MKKVLRLLNDEIKRQDLEIEVSEVKKEKDDLILDKMFILSQLIDLLKKKKKT